MLRALPPVGYVGDRGAGRRVGRSGELVVLAFRATIRRTPFRGDHGYG